MSQLLSPDEVALVIQGRKILKARDFDQNTDIKTLCEAAGISRKTGYQRAQKLMEPAVSEEQSIYAEIERLRAEHKVLKRRFDDVRFENEGRKIAWEIHEVDKLLAEKKALRPGAKEKSGRFFSERKTPCSRKRLGIVCFHEHLEWLEPGV